MKITRIVLVAAAFAGVPGTLHSQAVPDRPFIMSSTFWGGSGVEDFATVATDAAGNVYVAGSGVNATCPTQGANLFFPNNGITVSNPASLLWFVDSPPLVTVSVVVVLSSDGRLIGQWATQNNQFSIPVTLSSGNYLWYVATWNSTCGAVLAGPGTFRTTGTVTPSP